MLDEDHFDLEKIKERILEHLAVLKLNPQAKAPILCFVGPAGRGQDFAGPIDRPFTGPQVERMSLGACTMSPSCGATGAPTSAPCPAASSRPSVARASTIPC